MDPILIVILAAVAIAIAVFAFRGKGTRALPPGAAAKDTAAELEAGAVEAEPSPADSSPAAEPAEAGQAEPSEPHAEQAESPDAGPTEVVDEQVPASRDEDLTALKKGLKTTRGGFITKLAKIFGQKKAIDPALLDEIEDVLLGADIGVRTADKLLTRLRERLEKQELGDPDRIWEALREDALEILGGDHGEIAHAGQPAVILVVGVNGVGKTTTIGKLASRFKGQGKKVVLAAGDTFRAAAVLQLDVWGRRVGCPVVKGSDRADPASVIFDAIKQAKEDGADVVIADTAGRLHTKAPLMEELKKVYRTVEKALDGRAADEVMLVLDATNGQNAIQQAQQFKEALPLTGISLTKLDGTAKGGVILGIVDEHKIPLRYIGIGERVEDLRAFDAHSFVDALFSKPDDDSIAA